MAIKVKILPHGKIPTKAHYNDAGYDFYAPKRTVLRPHTTELIMTGVCIALPEGYFGDIRSRSSMFKKGINTSGTIDEGYRGEIGIMLYNSSDYYVEINEGDRIAQMVIIKCFSDAIMEVDELDDTDRGSGGFGSSGK